MPPTIIEPQSTRVAEVAEHSDVSLQCKANGHPRPTITWRRDDGSPIRLGGRLVGAGLISEDQANQTLSPLSIFASGSQSSNLSMVELPPKQTNAGALSRKYTAHRRLNGTFLIEKLNWLSD